MRFGLNLVLLSSLLTIAGCSAHTNQSSSGSQSAVVGASPAVVSASPVSQPYPATAPAQSSGKVPKVDACGLLTSREIESVQGEAVKETKPTGQSTSGFSISQCFFTLPTFTNSVSLLVAQTGEGIGSRDPKDFWRDTFHEEKAGEKDKDRGNKGDKNRREEEVEGAPPVRVKGVGDEAYWTGNRVGGALYVLKGNSYVRISIGGPADQTTKISRSKSLAQKAIARL